MRRSFATLLALVALLTAGCTALTGQASELQGTDWVLKVYETADGAAALAMLAPPTTATFERGTLSGNGGCNTYTASYELRGRSMTIGPAAATSMACPSPQTDQEQAFFAALARVSRYEVDGEALTLRDDSGRPILVFAASRPLPLAGTPWRATAVNNGTGGVVSIATETDITAYFGADERVSGFAGCNRYAGPYRALAASIRIGPFATTQMACEAAGISEQEAAYLAALERARRYEISGATLELRDRDGALQVSFELALLPEPSAAPSPEPSATPTAKPSATPSPTPGSTPKPTPAPTPSPTPKPTAGPTSTPRPTSGPTATPSPTPVALATCPLAAAGVVVSYPSAWYTVTDVPELTCVLYGPEPVTVDPETRQTNATVTVIATSAVTYADVVAALTNQTTWESVTTAQVTVSTLPATKITGTATGAGSIPAGVTQYAYVVDRGGPNGVVIIETAAQADDPDLAANAAVVDLMAAEIQIDVRPE
jgi:heat shock protein HslJ